MFEAAHPCDKALHAHAEAAVRNSAEAAQVEIPLERLARQVMFFQALLEKREIVNALAAPDDFAVAFRSDHVHPKRELGSLCIGLEIERFDLARETVDDDRAIEI